MRRTAALLACSVLFLLGVVLWVAGSFGQAVATGAGLALEFEDRLALALLAWGRRVL